MEQKYSRYIHLNFFKCIYKTYCCLSSNPASFFASLFINNINCPRNSCQDFHIYVGIPAHIDTHSVFEDTILSLSLGSTCMMDFKRGEEKLSLLLPSRSILVMSEESRYSWSHGICPRYSDTIRTENGTTVQKRGIRTSFTFRKVRRGDCECHYPECCDSRKNKEAISESNASGLENLYVHEANTQFY